MTNLLSETEQAIYDSGHNTKENYEGRPMVSEGIRVVAYDRYPDEYWQCYIQTDSGEVGGGYALKDDEVGKRLRQLVGIVPREGRNPFIALLRDNTFIGAVDPKSGNYVLFSEGVE